MSEQCPCGSGLAYEQCCRPYLEGKTWPETAEALVRSRYTAYGSGHFDYLVETTHPDYRDGITAERLAQSAEGVRWHRLDIAATAENVPAGENGERYDTVDFRRPRWAATIPAPAAAGKNSRNAAASPRREHAETSWHTRLP